MRRCVRHVTSGADVEKEETKQAVGRHLHFAKAANLRPEVLRPVGAAGRADGEVVHLGNSTADQRQLDQASLAADDVAPNEGLRGEGLASTGGGEERGAGSRDKWRHDKLKLFTPLGGVHDGGEQSDLLRCLVRREVKEKCVSGECVEK